MKWLVKGLEGMRLFR